MIVEIMNTKTVFKYYMTIIEIIR